MNCKAGRLLRYWFILTMLLTGCMPQGSGPSPRAVLVVSSSEYALDDVVYSLDSIRSSLDARVDKSEEKIAVGSGSIPRFSYYEVAYWYPSNGSNYYGVGLAKWNIDQPDMSNRYFIEVYAEDETCLLCGEVESTLASAGINYFSACENPELSTEYEKIRCGD